ncbi:hypothetical protein J4212_00020 [Candidatus Woesearchaeota archaeon]|nr:hypothetical protein [Candidatus Woesearchaeota archaeon]
MRASKKAAVLMILLVISMPIYSAAVLGQLSNVQARGLDSINGYIREQDAVTFNAVASISSDADITKNQVLLGSATKPFDSCKPHPNGFECTKRHPSNGTAQFGFGPFSPPTAYTIVLKDDGGNTVNTYSSTLYIDNLRPKVDKIKTQSEFVKKGDIEFSYNLTDTACNDALCAGKCSGIKKLELFTNDGTLNKTVEIDTDKCSYANTEKVSTNVFGEGEFTIFARAYDRIGNPSLHNSVIFSVDTQAPIVIANTFMIADDYGFEIKHVAPNKASATAIVEIKGQKYEKGTDLDMGNVHGDFSSLAPNANQASVKGNCALSNVTELTSTCKFPVVIDAKEAGPKKIVIKATDFAGNIEVTELSPDFGLDTIGPAVRSLGSSKMSGNISFLNPDDNTIIAKFKEDGSGLNPDLVFLSVEKKSIKAASCGENVCKWEKVSIDSKGKAILSINKASDRLGNPLEKPFSADAIVDVTKPLITQYSVKAIASDNPLGSGIIKTGDRLQVEINVTDDLVDKASIDVSDFLTENAVVESQCTKIQGKLFTCSFETNPIDRKNFILGSVFVTVEDLAGNKAQQDILLQVLGIYPGQDLNLWKNTAECSPSLIDRQTAPLISHKVYCRVSLDPRDSKQSNIKPAAIGFDGCSQNAGIENAEILNNEYGSKSPIIKLILKQQEYKVDSLNITCPIFITTRAGNEITPSPEKEEVAIDIKFYNLPAGELEASVQKKIDDAVKDATGTLNDIIGGLKKIEFYATKICTVIGAINNAVAALKAVGAMISGSAEGAKGTPVYPYLRGVRVAQDTTTEEFREYALFGIKFLDKFCSAVNCKATFDDSGKVDFSLGGAETVMAKWQQGGNSIINTMDVGGIVQRYVGSGGKVAPASNYMNPKDSIVVATLTACIPGIISGLDKYRQIECMYAVCLQEGVGKQGLPVMACEDQRSYAACKYVVGEAFNVIPITAAFDHFAGMFKGALSNPLELIGVAIGFVCKPTIVSPSDSAYNFCAGAKVATMVLNSIQNIKSVIDSWGQEGQDFCKQVD